MQNNNQENIINRNVDDIFVRNATLSVLDLLNRQVIIDLKRNDTVEKHEVPFFYNFSGDEGFMKDFFIDIPSDCKYPRAAEGNYEVLPRGIVTLSSFAIRPGDVTNKFVRGSFNQETRDVNDQKQLLAYSSRLFALPITLKYTLKIESDNLNKTFKILEKIFDFYYKNQVRYFQFRGTRIPGQITFPDTAEFQKQYNFDYTTDNKVFITLSLDFETYFPSFDDYSTRFKGNTIKQFNHREKIAGSEFVISDTFVDQDFPPSEI